MLIKLGCSGMAVPGGMITLSHFLRLHCESRKINEETHYVTTGVASTRERDQFTFARCAQSTRAQERDAYRISPASARPDTPAVRKNLVAEFSTPSTR